MSAHGSLSPDQFAQQFRPSEYGLNWDHVREHVHDEQCCGGWMEPDHNARLQESIRREGLHTPVVVKDGWVTDGHHRAAHAMEVGVPIPFEEGDEHHEGQIAAARRGEPMGWDD